MSGQQRTAEQIADAFLTPSEHADFSNYRARVIDAIRQAQREAVEEHSAARLSIQEAARLYTTASVWQRRAYAEGVEESGHGEGPALERRRDSVRRAQERFTQVLVELTQGRGKHGYPDPATLR